MNILFQFNKIVIILLLFNNSNYNLIFSFMLFNLSLCKNYYDSKLTYFVIFCTYYLYEYYNVYRFILISIIMYQYSIQLANIFNYNLIYKKMQFIIHLYCLIQIKNSVLLKLFIIQYIIFM